MICNNSKKLKDKYWEFLKQWSLEKSGCDNIFCFNNQCIPPLTLDFVNQLLEEYVNEVCLGEQDYKGATLTMDLKFNLDLHPLDEIQRREKLT